MANENAQTPGAQPKKVNKALDTVVNVILVMVIVFGILSSYTAFVSARGDGVPEIFGAQFFAIQSESMEPTFFKGDLIVDTQIKDYSTLKVGDIITFWTVINGERVLNTHRITAITDQGNYLYFTTRGDNNPIEDALGVHQSEIVGQYKFAIPKLGSVINFMQTSMGFLLVIVLPVFLFFVYNVVQFFKVFFDYRMEKMRLQLKQEMLMQEQAAKAAAEPAQETPPATAPPAEEPKEEEPKEEEPKEEEPKEEEPKEEEPKEEEPKEEEPKEEEPKEEESGEATEAPKAEEAEEEEKPKEETVEEVQADEGEEKA